MSPLAAGGVTGSWSFDAKSSLTISGEEGAAEGVSLTSSSATDSLRSSAGLPPASEVAVGALIEPFFFFLDFFDLEPEGSGLVTSKVPPVVLTLTLSFCRIFLSAGRARTWYWEALWSWISSRATKSFSASRSWSDAR